MSGELILGPADVWIGGPLTDEVPEGLSLDPDTGELLAWRHLGVATGGRIEAELAPGKCRFVIRERHE